MFYFDHKLFIHKFFFTIYDFDEWNLFLFRFRFVLFLDQNKAEWTQLSDETGVGKCFIDSPVFFWSANFSRIELWPCSFRKPQWSIFRVAVALFALLIYRFYNTMSQAAQRLKRNIWKHITSRTKANWAPNLFPSCRMFNVKKQKVGWMSAAGNQSITWKLSSETFNFIPYQIMMKKIMLVCVKNQRLCSYERMKSKFGQMSEMWIELEMNWGTGLIFNGHYMFVIISRRKSSSSSLSNASLIKL